VGAADFEDPVPCGEERIFLLVRVHPFGQERPAAADDAHLPFQGQGDMAAEKPGVQGHEIHALRGLFLDDVEKEFGGEGGGVALEAGNGLVQGHSAKRNGAGLQHALADGGQIRADAQVHDEIGAGLEGDLELAQFLAGGAAFRGASEIGVDLGAEGAPGDRGKVLGMGGIIRENGAPRGDLVADSGRRGIFQARDLLHDGGNDALAGLNQLGTHENRMSFRRQKTQDIAFRRGSQ